MPRPLRGLSVRSCDARLAKGGRKQKPLQKHGNNKSSGAWSVLLPLPLPLTLITPAQRRAREKRRASIHSRIVNRREPGVRFFWLGALKSEVQHLNTDKVLHDECVEL